MSTAAVPVPLMTAEEFAARHENDRVELVRGVVVEVPMPNPEHGSVCFEFAGRLYQYLREHKIGRAFTNDTFVRTMRGPDSVRGPDICFFSYGRLPKGKVPRSLIDAAPDFVVEVRSPTDRMKNVTAKVSEYLTSGVLAILILDPEMEAATVFRDNELPQTFHNGDTLVVSDVLPGFAVPLAELFA